MVEQPEELAYLTGTCISQETAVAFRGGICATQWSGIYVLLSLDCSSLRDDMGVPIRGLLADVVNVSGSDAILTRMLDLVRMVPPAARTTAAGFAGQLKRTYETTTSGFHNGLNTPHKYRVSPYTCAVLRNLLTENCWQCAMERRANARARLALRRPSCGG